MKIVLFFSLFLLLAAPTFSQKDDIEVKPEMVTVNGGDFLMGNNYSTVEDEKPQRKVSIKTFSIAKYEVTNEQYSVFCDFTSIEHPDPDPLHGKLVVVNVSFFDAIRYCNWLSERELLDPCYEIKADSGGTRETAIYSHNKNGYRLPTEAEWEYAARGGAPETSKRYTYSGGRELDAVAWYIENSNNAPHEPGQKKANELGVFDMTGNGLEWCNDWYSAKYYSKGENNNPQGPAEGSDRVCRGGHFLSIPDVMRSTKRYQLAPPDRKGLASIRVVKNQ